MAALQALKELEKKASAATRSIKALDRRLADIETGAFSVRTGVVERRQELEAHHPEAILSADQIERLHGQLKRRM